MSNKSIATVVTMGIDIGKNSFHVVGLDRRGAIVLRQKWSRDRRLAIVEPGAGYLGIGSMKVCRSTLSNPFRLPT